MPSQVAYRGDQGRLLILHARLMLHLLQGKPQDDSRVYHVPVMAAMQGSNRVTNQVPWISSRLAMAQRPLENYIRNAYQRPSSDLKEPIGLLHGSFSGQQ